MLKTLLLIGFGGGIGSMLRYLTSVLTTKLLYHNFPLATFLVNIVGCLLVGLLVGIFEQRQLLDSNLKYLFITGFCGGFTTFSAFSLESFTMFQNGNYLFAVLYITASILFGLLAVWGGFSLIK